MVAALKLWFVVLVVVVVVKKVENEREVEKVYLFLLLRFFLHNCINGIITCVLFLYSNTIAYNVIKITKKN